MSESAEFPELSDHSEFSSVEVNETLTVTEKTIADIKAAAERLVAIQECRRISPVEARGYGRVEGNKYYWVEHYPEGLFPTGLVAAVEVSSAADISKSDKLRTRYHIFKRERLELERDVLAPLSEFGSIDDPQVVAQFKAYLANWSQSQEQAKALRLLDISQKEGEEI